MIDYAKLIILGGIFLVGAGFGWYFPHRALVEYKTSVENAVKAQEAHVESIKKQQEITTTSIQKEYDAKLALLRQYYANGVRQPSANKLPTISSTTSGIDPTAAYSILIEQCAETTQQLVSLQEWLNEQMGIK
jgi:hypothetical protein